MNSQWGTNGCRGGAVVRSEPATSGSASLFIITHPPMKPTLFALLCAFLVLPLAACGGDDAADTAVTTDDGVMDDGAMDDAMMDDADSAGDVAAAVDLPGTIAAAGDDITDIEPAGALANINGWINTLAGQEFTNATEIRDGLMTLRDQLSADELDGAAIGATLTDLGTWTKASAPDNAEIQTLGDALLAGGAKLTGM
ncbi:MAG: hypothetical protein Rubg2KO_18260 [Rubricoccaceae bacterium]